MSTEKLFEAAKAQLSSTVLACGQDGVPLHEADKLYKNDWSESLVDTCKKLGIPDVRAFVLAISDKVRLNPNNIIFPKVDDNSAECFRLVAETGQERKSKRRSASCAPRRVRPAPAFSASRRPVNGSSSSKISIFDRLTFNGNNVPLGGPKPRGRIGSAFEISTPTKTKNQTSPLPKPAFSQASPTTTKAAVSEHASRFTQSAVATKPAVAPKPVAPLDVSSTSSSDFGLCLDNPKPIKNGAEREPVKATRAVRCTVSPGHKRAIASYLTPRGHPAVLSPTSSKSASVPAKPSLNASSGSFAMPKHVSVAPFSSSVAPRNPPASAQRPPRPAFTQSAFGRGTSWKPAVPSAAPSTQSTSMEYGPVDWDTVNVIVELVRKNGCMKMDVLEREFSAATGLPANRQTFRKVFGVDTAGMHLALKNMRGSVFRYNSNKDTVELLPEAIIPATTSGKPAEKPSKAEEPHEKPMEEKPAAEEKSAENEEVAQLSERADECKTVTESAYTTSTPNPSSSSDKEPEPREAGDGPGCSGSDISSISDVHSEDVPQEQSSVSARTASAFYLNTAAQNIISTVLMLSLANKNTLKLIARRYEKATGHELSCTVFGDAFGFVPIDLFRGFKHVRQFFTVDDFTLRVQVRPCILRSGLSDGDLFLFDAAEQLLACGPHLQVDPTLLRNARDSQAAPAQCFGLRGLTLAVDTNQDILGALRILRN